MWCSRQGIVEDAAPPRLVYNPDHPDADPQGYVRMPNVNVLEEMVDLIDATRAYEANVAALNATKKCACVPWISAAGKLTGRWFNGSPDNGKTGNAGFALEDERTFWSGSGNPVSEYYWRALQDVNDLQREAERKAEEVVAGNAQSFHEVVIAMEKAALGLQLLARFQNKAVEAYQEIMRLQL